MACATNVIGAAFLRPQGIGRAPTDDSSAALVQDLLNLATRLMTDSAQGARIVDVLGESIATSAVRFLEHSRAGMDSARERLQTLLQSLINGVSELGQSLPDVEDPAKVVDAAQQLLSKLTPLLENVSIDQLRLQVGEVLDIIEKDLGLTSDFIEEQIWVLIDETIVRLQQMPPETTVTERETRLEIVSILRRVKRQLSGQFTFPQFNADQIAAMLLALLRDSGLEKLTRKVACAGSELNEAIGASKTLIELVPYSSGFASGSLGAAQPRTVGEKYCWYASWLLGNKDTEALKKDTTELKDKIEYRSWYRPEYLPLHLAQIPFLGWKDDIWIDTEGKKIFKDDQVIHNGTDLEWTSLPVFNDYDGVYSFKHTDREAIEKWARVTSWLGDYAVAILHILPSVSLKKGDYLSHSLNASEKAFEGTFKVITDAPFSWWLHRVAKLSPWLRHPLDTVLLKAGPTLGGSLEGWHSNASRKNWIDFQLTQTLGDFVKTYKYRSYINTARGFLLSFLTLRNFEGPVRLEPPLDGPSPFYKADVPDNRPLNRAEIDGVADVFVSLSTLLMVKSVKRKDYGHPFAGGGERIAKMWFLWMLLGGVGFGFLGGFVGTVVAEIIAWAEDWSVLGKKMLSSVLQVWIGFWPALYFGKEGDTDGGKYNPQGADFRGYPDNSNSPYLLPYNKGDARVCGQGNQGMWSHNDLGGVSQVYAFDFGLDEGEEILASRPGTVVTFDDTNPDEGSTQNFILIRHDQDLSRDALGNRNDSNVEHDRDAGGAVITTFSRYLHGKQGSVTQAFAAGTPQIETGTVAGTISGAGDVLVTVTATGLIGSPIAVNVAVLVGDSPEVVAGKIRVALAAHPLIGTFFDVAGTGDQVILTTRVNAATDATMNIATATGTATGLTAAPTSANTAPGSAPGAIGPTVARGQVIMLAGDTGTSFHNHLHMQVQNAASTATAYTIPFVFREVSNIFGPDGVPQALTYYTSDNQKVP